MTTRWVRYETAARLLREAYGLEAPGIAVLGAGGLLLSGRTGLTGGVPLLVAAIVWLWWRWRCLSTASAELYTASVDGPEPGAGENSIEQKIIEELGAGPSGS